VERRLVDGKRLYFSEGGWLILIKSTLSNLPTYYLALFPISVVVANWMGRLEETFCRMELVTSLISI
jgi:hypothetical protein